MTVQRATVDLEGVTVSITVAEHPSPELLAEPRIAAAIDALLVVVDRVSGATDPTDAGAAIAQARELLGVPVAPGITVRNVLGSHGRVLGHG